MPHKGGHQKENWTQGAKISCCKKEKVLPIKEVLGWSVLRCTPGTDGQTGDTGCGGLADPKLKVPDCAQDPPKS